MNRRYLLASIFTIFLLECLSNRVTTLDQEKDSALSGANSRKAAKDENKNGTEDALYIAKQNYKLKNSLFKQPDQKVLAKQGVPSLLRRG